MKRIRTITALLSVLLCAALLLSGCAGNKLAATVGDQTITVRELENGYNQTVSRYSMYGISIITAEQVDYLLEDVLSTLIQNRMLAYQAKLAGFTLTAEEEAAAKAEADEAFQSYKSDFVLRATSAGASEPDVYANSLMTDDLLARGTTLNGLKKLIQQDAQNTRLIEKHKAALLEGVAYTEDELRGLYDDALAAQKAAIDEDPGKYDDYADAQPYGHLYTPENLFRVRQILVTDEATAQEVKGRIDAGEDFETLLAEYNTDSSMDSTPDGYWIYATAPYVEPFLNAALALAADGDVSDIVHSDYGYHIIKRVSTPTPGTVAYEDVQAAAAEYQQNALLENTYNEIVSGWVNDASLVVRNPENYSQIGKKGLPTAAPTAAPTATVAPTAEDAEK